MCFGAGGCALVIGWCLQDLHQPPQHQSPANTALLRPVSCGGSPVLSAAQKKVLVMFGVADCEFAVQGKGALHAPGGGPQQ